MLTGPLDSGSKAQQLRFGDAAEWLDGDDLGFAFGERPGLVDNQCIDLLQVFERFGVLD